MKTYLFEIFAPGDDSYTYQEVNARTLTQAREQLLAEIPNAYVVQVFTPCTE